MFSGDDHAVSSLQNAAVEVIGTLARATGEENFRPYAHQSIELGLRMLNSALDDPETAKVTYFYKSTWILLDISLKIRMDFTQISCAHFLIEILDMSMRRDSDVLLLLYILSNNQLLCLSLLDSKSKPETPNDKACSKFPILDK